MKRTLLRWQLRCVVRHRRMLVDAALALVVDVRRWLRHGHRSEDRFCCLASDLAEGLFGGRLGDGDDDGWVLRTGSHGSGSG